MKFRTVNILQGMIALAFAVSNVSHADWAQSPSARVVRPAPANLQVQPQNPPSFTWAMHSTKPAAYVLELTRSGGVAETFTTDRNWFLPTAALAAGTYTWRVRPANSTDWSSPRSFVIDATKSKAFIVPENAVLKQRVTAKVHPRGLNGSATLKSTWSAAQTAERGAPLTRLSNAVLVRITSIPVYTDANWTLNTTGTMTAAVNTQLSNIRWAMMDVTRQVEASALLWRLTGNRTFLNEAIKRGNQLAALSPSGPTSYASSDQGCRMIAMALAKAVDFLAADLDATTKARWLGIIENRTNQMYDAFQAWSVSSGGGMDQFPFDSHGQTVQGYIALIAALTLGDIPSAEKWFDWSVRSYVHSIYPWSGPEGGFANGTSYGQHTALSSLEVWQPLAYATGVNLFDKPWSEGFMRSFVHFQPPGSVRHTFGDEHEQAPQPTELKGFASRFDTPEAAWYSKSLGGEEDPLTLLQAPYPLPVTRATTTTAPPNGALYPSIGWAAMHSDITNPLRTSLYFKSSPYGSLNHSHGDQNSLVLNSGGRPLLIESGYMDWYGSPLWNDWYRQTKAHNAITFDGGKGQNVGGNYDTNLTRNGTITSFASTPGMDYVEGDATPAYDGVLTRARRQMWYLRAMDAVIVRDTLDSATAHTYEWNFHAPVVMNVANNVATITNVDRSVCVRPVTGDMTLEKRVGAAPKAGVVEDHAAFVKAPATKAEFLVVLDVGCKNPTIALTPTATGRTLTVGGVNITLPNY
ncbi:heparinase II/III domain-containing protein [Massilia endophytica]|uniref:heparinase II/III domain-containing protein n=1 Tax=Massilia endophytica TaxID=2899220 RepID=UPI001E4BDB63|nr:heparinase II/III family protein [Massilia endophytica]UGQ47646.1 heparinase II/III family protein [Massilia endophytica]